MSMTMAEKILARASGKDRVAPNECVTAALDKAVTHEGLALVAMTLQKAGVKTVWDSDRIIVALDHYVPAPTIRAATIHQMVRKAVKAYGIKNFYGINGGVAHQIMVEKGHVLPGELIVGTDSHTCTYGAFGAAGCGIGISEMACVAATGKLWFRVPETIRFNLTGVLVHPVTSKDLILKIAGGYSEGIAQYKSIEFTGPGAAAMSLSSRMTVSNMVVEVGAKFGFFYPDEKVKAYLAERAEGWQEAFAVDENSIVSEEFEINLSNIEPQVALPHSVDNVVAISDLKDVQIDQAVLGSCTNGRLEDLQVAATIIGKRKVHSDTRFLITPASWEIYHAAMTDGTLGKLIEAGGVILTPGCGPCFGGHMGLLAPGENCISSTNRNFKGRMGSDQANVYLASPATVAASAVAGRITDPRES